MRWLRFVRGLSIREIHGRTGLHPETIRGALSGPPLTLPHRPRAGG
jgi:hypothetical protein